MSTDVSAVVKHFPSPQNGFTTTLASTISSAAATVPLNSVAGYTNGQVVVFIVDPSDLSKKQTFTGTVDTAGVQVTGVVWTAGTNQAHSGGATIVDYAAATHIAMMTKGLLAAGITQAGGMGAISPTSITSAGTITAANFVQTGGASANGWTVGLTVPNTVTALGNRSYNLVVNSTDLTSQVSVGMRLKLTRTVLAPTQCTSLNGTTQYWVKTSPNKLTFTDDFVVSAWVKLISYPAAGSLGVIGGRSDGTSGFGLWVNETGQIVLNARNGAAVNFSRVTSYQSIPLNKWVFVTAQLDMSTFTATPTTSYVMIDGVDVPAAVLRGGSTPTALVQAGNFAIGAQGDATLFLNGKVAQFAVYNAKVTQATILTSMNQTLAGTETSLASAYSFNNVITDLMTTTPNDLSVGGGSAVATNADSPFGGQADGTISSTLDYAIITKTAFSTNTTLTVQVPEGCTIPTSGGVSAVSYSTQKVPYLFPSQTTKWQVLYILKTGINALAVANTYYSGPTVGAGSTQISVPIGEWNGFYDVNHYSDSGAGVAREHNVTFSTNATTESDNAWTTRSAAGVLTATSTFLSQHTKRWSLTAAAATPYYILWREVNGSTANNTLNFANLAACFWGVECAYL